MCNYNNDSPAGRFGTLAADVVLEAEVAGDPEANEPLALNERPVLDAVRGGATDETTEATTGERCPVVPSAASRADCTARCTASSTCCWRAAVDRGWKAGGAAEVEACRGCHPSWALSLCSVSQGIDPVSFSQVSWPVCV